MGIPLGTAAWTPQDEVAARFPYREGMFWLGRAADGTPVGCHDDRHICLVSGNRGGKGVSSIITNLCLWPGSVVVVDPKGENATITAARRGRGARYCEGMGQDVYVLDPFEAAEVETSYRSCFNPLDALDPANNETIDEAARLADAIVVMRPDAKDPFWDESARRMVKGLILHILTAPELEGRRNLVTLRKFIQGGDRETVELLRAAGEEGIPSSQAFLWDRVSESRAFGGLVGHIGDGFCSMYKNAPKEFEGVLQQANTQTEFLDSPALQRVVSKTDFALSDLKTKPGGVSLYLSLPQRYMPTHFRWLRMMISLTLTEMEKVKGLPVGGHRVLFCLDEFAGLERMKVIENGVAQMAGFGVKFLFVLQSLEQLKGTYQEKWETFLSNSGLKVLFNVDDHFSREYVSKLVGDMEIMREVHTENKGEGETENITESTGLSKNESIADSSNWTYSTNESTNRSIARSESENINESETKSGGASMGSSWDPNSLLAPTVQRSASHGSYTGNAQSKGHGQGWSKTDSEGTSVGRGDSKGGGTTETTGTTTNESTAKAKGVSRQHSSGKNETLHRRPLLPPDEIGRMFTRITDKGHDQYPGLGLVVISGEQAMSVRRVNYYEDLYFIGLFQPHPDHKFNPPQEYRLESKQLAAFSLGWRLTVADRSLVQAGDVIGEACRSLAGMGFPGMEESMPLASYPPIKAPVSGRIRRGRKKLVSSVAPASAFMALDGVMSSETRNAVRESMEVMIASARGLPTADVPTILTYSAVSGGPDPFRAVIARASEEVIALAAMRQRAADAIKKAEADKKQAELSKAMRLASEQVAGARRAMETMMQAQAAEEKAQRDAGRRKALERLAAVQQRKKGPKWAMAGSGALAVISGAVGVVTGVVPLLLAGAAGLAALGYAGKKLLEVGREERVVEEEIAKYSIENLKATSPSFGEWLAREAPDQAGRK